MYADDGDNVYVRTSMHRALIERVSRISGKMHAQTDRQRALARAIVFRENRPEERIEPQVHTTSIDCILRDPTTVLHMITKLASHLQYRHQVLESGQYLSSR